MSLYTIKINGKKYAEHLTMKEAAEIADELHEDCTIERTGEYLYSDIPFEAEAPAVNI